MSLTDPRKAGFDFITLQAEKDDTLAIFHQKNVWICNTDVSTHIVWSNIHARNVHDIQILGLKHTGKAMNLQP